MPLEKPPSGARGVMLRLMPWVGAIILCLGLVPALLLLRQDSIDFKRLGPSLFMCIGGVSLIHRRTGFSRKFWLFLLTPVAIAVAVSLAA